MAYADKKKQAEYAKKWQTEKAMLRHLSFAKKTAKKLVWLKASRRKEILEPIETSFYAAEAYLRASK